MKTRLLLVPICLALLGAVYFYARMQPSAPARVTAVVPVPVQPIAIPVEKKTDPALKTERDAAAVFQRAFWRRPGPDVRIVNGERRDWIERGTAVQKWQWFLSLQTTPEFRRWLFEQNPFELALSKDPVDAARVGYLPDWFPAATAWADLTTYRVRGGAFTVFLEAKSGRLFAMDAGAGFAAAVR